MNRPGRNGLPFAEERFLDFLESASDWFWETGPDLRIRFVSDNVEKATGQPAAWYIGKTRRELGDSADPECWRQHLDDLDNRRPFNDFVSTRRRPDGQMLWLSSSGKPLYDAAGRFTGYRGIDRDVTELKQAGLALEEANRELGKHVAERTKELAERNQQLAAEIAERKRAEQALRESERRYQIAAEAGQVGVWDWNLETGEMYLAPNLKGMLGYRDLEVPNLASEWMKYVHPDDAERTMADAENHRHGLTPEFSNEHRKICKGGAVRWFRVSGVCIRDATGKAVRMIGSDTDITEHRRTEQALRLARFSIDRAGDAVIWIARDGSLMYANETACQRLGYSREELLSLNVADVDPDLQSWQNAWPIVKDLGTTTVERQQRTKDGTIISAEVSAYYLEHGSTEIVCTISRDITERKTAEAAMLEAKESAEVANQAKSRFLAAANHDLRQPMQALNLHLSELSQTQDPAEQGVIIDDMRQALQTMGSLLNGLLDIDKLEQNEVPVEITVCPVAELLHQIASDFSLQARKKGLDLRIVTSDLHIESDPALLGRILQNFVANAVRYTHRGKIRIGCRRHDGFVRIEVWDSGIGIAEDELTSIFEDYYQLGNPARDREKGLGLGLSIVQRIARLLGHHIGVRSKPGKGTVFWVDVPVSKTTRKPAASTETNAVGSAASEGARIIVIEDDPTILRAIKALLEKWGARVIAAQDAEGVLVQLAARPGGHGFAPDLLLADYRLAAGSTGVDAARRVMASLGRSVNTVILTGDTDSGITREIRIAGFEVLHKPLDPMALQSMVADLNQPGTDGVQQPSTIAAARLSAIEEVSDSVPPAH